MSGTVIDLATVRSDRAARVAENNAVHAAIREERSELEIARQQALDDGLMFAPSPWGASDDFSEARITALIVAKGLRDDDTRPEVAPRVAEILDRMAANLLIAQKRASEARNH